MANKSSPRGPISLKIWIYGFFGALMKICEFEENQNFACAQPQKDLESLAKSVLMRVVSCLAQLKYCVLSLSA